jgi:S1-C subfamily serine protease
MNKQFWTAFTAVLIALGAVGNSSAAASAWQEIENQSQQVFNQNKNIVVGITVKPVRTESNISPNLLAPTDTATTTQSQKTNPAERFMDELFLRERVATGLVVSHEGHILTTGSVVRSSTRESIAVTLADGAILPATPVARDTYTNLAVLKVDKMFEEIPRFGHSRDLAPGSMLLCIARPYGRTNSLFFGMTSNVMQEIGHSRYENLLQTTVPLHPGSIGSPVFNFKGEIVGMLSATQKQSSWPELSFAIPSEMLSYITQQILAHGEITRGFLGLWVKPVSTDDRKEKILPEEVDGVMITRLLEGGPAEEAGLRVGDILTHFNTHPVVSTQQLIWQTAITPPGEVIPVDVWRNGESRKVAVKLALFFDPSHNSGENH